MCLVHCLLFRDDRPTRFYGFQFAHLRDLVARLFGNLSYRWKFPQLVVSIVISSSTFFLPCCLEFRYRWKRWKKLLRVTSYAVFHGLAGLISRRCNRQPARRYRLRGLDFSRRRGAVVAGVPQRARFSALLSDILACSWFSIHRHHRSRERSSREEKNRLVAATTRRAIVSETRRTCTLV